MAKSDSLAIPNAERKPGKQVIVLTVLLLVLCQSQQILASGGISLFLPLIRQDVGLDFTQGGTLAVALGLQFWLPTFVVVEKGYSLQVAGLVVALGAALTVPSNFLGGYLSDRLRNPLLIIGTALAMLALTTILLVRVENLALLLCVCALNGLFVQLYFGPLFNVPIEMLGPEIAGLASGFGNFFANLGALTFTYTLGALKDATGSFDVGLYGIAGLCLLALVCTLLLARMKLLAREEAAAMRELP